MTKETKSMRTLIKKNKLTQKKENFIATLKIIKAF